MKQILFYLLLFLTPYLAMAQYPANGNQKITLGEQTTADGIIWRGVAGDTTLTAKSDTAAYFVLDTVNKKLYFFKASATPKWNEISGSGGGGGGTVTSITAGTGLTGGTITSTGTIAADLSVLMELTDTVSLSNRINAKLNISDTASMLSNYNSRINAKLNISDTASMLTPYIERGDTSSMLTNYWRSGRFSGTLPVANGGTNAGAFTAGSVVFAGSSGTYTQDNSGFFWDNTNKRLGINDNTPTSIMDIKGNIPGGGGGGGLSFIPTVSNDNTTQYGITTQGTGSGASQFILIGLRNGSVTTKASGIWLEPTQPGLNIGNDYTLIAPSNGAAIAGETWIGYTTDQGAYPLQVNGQIFATNATIATSDIKYKENITPLNKGLEILNKLKPVTFNFINNTKNNFSEYEELGFIAQDVDRALSTETFAKSIVKAADDSDPNSTMGLATQNLIPILVKAIQEQQAQIEQLKQRLLILENK